MIFKYDGISRILPLGFQNYESVIGKFDFFLPLFFVNTPLIQIVLRFLQHQRNIMSFCSGTFARLGTFENIGISKGKLVTLSNPRPLNCWGFSQVLIIQDANFFVEIVVYSYSMPGIEDMLYNCSYPAYLQIIYLVFLIFNIC